MCYTFGGQQSISKHAFYVCDLFTKKIAKKKTKGWSARKRWSKYAKPLSQSHHWGGNMKTKPQKCRVCQHQKPQKKNRNKMSKNRHVCAPPMPRVPKDTLGGLVVLEQGSAGDGSLQPVHIRGRRGQDPAAHLCRGGRRRPQDPSLGRWWSPTVEGQGEGSI